MSKENEILSSYMIDKKDSYITFVLRENYEDFEEICDIILKVYKKPNQLQKGTKYQGVTETLNLSKEFLRTINEKWSKDFEDKINDGRIVIYDANDKESEEYKEKGEWVGINTYNKVDFRKEEKDDVISMFRNNEHRINIPMQYRLIDTFHLIHEYAHSLIEEDGDLAELLCEMIPISFEYYLAKYLKDRNYDKKEIKEDIDIRIKCLIFQALQLKKYIKIYKENINKIDYDVEINEKRNNEILVDLRKYVEYLIGDLYGVCFYNDLNEGKASIETIKRYIRIINKDSNNLISGEFLNDFMINIVSYLKENSEEALTNLKEKYFSEENVKQIK